MRDGKKLVTKLHLTSALAMKDMGVKTIVYTDISKDGMLAGPNVEQTKLLSDKTGIDMIARAECYVCRIWKTFMMQVYTGL